MRSADAPLADPQHVETVVEALLDPVLEPIVDLVITADADAYEARAVDGSVRFVRADEGDGWSFREVAVEGRNPLADQATDRFSPLADEQATPQPHRSANSYPHAYEMVAQVFDHRDAPDVVILHTPAHNWEEAG